MRIAFLGNHTVGIRALEAIERTEQVVAVVAHPADPEDGARYESVYDFAQQRGWPVMRSKGKDPQLMEFLAGAKPNLLWITDYRYLLPPSCLSIASLGAVNLHPSLLPKYRGRAPVNWAILNGETHFGLTAHFVDEGMDTGDIIAQHSFELSERQDVGDALEILYPMYAAITKEVLQHFRGSSVPRRKQDHSQASAFGRRKPEDGRIDWTKPAREVLNLVRAVAAPYPGAFTLAEKGKLMVWKAQIVAEGGQRSHPGAVLEWGAQGPQVQCGAGVLALTKIERIAHTERALEKPDILLEDRV